MSYPEFWLAVIEQAVLDTLHPDITKPSHEEQADALAWIASDNCAPAGYLWACMAAGVRPSLARKQLKARGLL